LINAEENQTPCWSSSTIYQLSFTDRKQTTWTYNITET
jgi:hypothetical protein